MRDVDLVVNCYESTYRRVLTPGFVSDLAATQRHDFAAVTILINNVLDRSDAEAMAKELIEVDPGVSRVEFVTDHLEQALTRTHLTLGHLRRLPHFTDCALVAICLAGPSWICYWDADCTLHEPIDWITPVIAEMETDPRLAIGNPNTWYPGLAEREAVEIRGELAVGFGFSDQVFLARRAELAADIYRRVWRSPASWRYPMIETEPIFECRVDAWMRTSGRTRVTFLPAVYEHPDGAGANYPAVAAPRERLRRRVIRAVSPMAARLSAHPAARARS